MKKSLLKISLLAARRTGILIAFLIMTCQSFAQEKPTIAVANPNIVGLKTTTTIAAKLLRLELIKMDNYFVYDEFDMEDIYKLDSSYRNNCLSKSCLVRMGKSLGVDYMITGSFDELGNKIVLSLKVIDVKNASIFKTRVQEFDNQPLELQRMVEITLKEMHAIEVQQEIVDRLQFKNEVITSNNLGRIKNNGPRVGYGILTGSLTEFATRSVSQGGLGIFPAVSMIGYQLEAQYVGTENFSGLVEGIINVSGLEQGQFIPTITVMNGFRFGKAGWEFAFGPGFGLKSESYGFFDTNGSFGDVGSYISQNDWQGYADKTYNDIDLYPEFFLNGYYTRPDVSEVNPDYNLNEKHADKRGKVSISTSFVFGFGRTFRAGALNMPVNIFYSSKKGGGLLGINIGFNVLRSKESINKEGRFI
ncbi:hypothetical protein N9963_03720 [Crocinitomicaceae bacterium]|nr:hypothetical protein [Crocinitomicaceae bacterium]